MTRVVHIQHEPYDVYIGRAAPRARPPLPASKWRNPFTVGRDGDRATVIARYGDEHLPAHPELLASLSELEGLTLGCWCAPLPCHGDVLVELLDDPPEDDKA